VSSSSSIPPEVLQCEACGEDRPFILRCTRCGDRLEESANLSPYERLNITPRPLYHQRDIRAAEVIFLHEFHALKASRQLARWSLKQRALVRRDAKLLCSLSGSLGSYLKLCILCIDASGELMNWGVPLSHTLQALSIKFSDHEVRSSVDMTLDVFLLDTAYREVDEYDGYQERERLLNHFTREMLTQAHALAAELEVHQDCQQGLKMVSARIIALQHLEVWIDQHRQKSISPRV